MGAGTLIFGSISIRSSGPAWNSSSFLPCLSASDAQACVGWAEATVDVAIRARPRASVSVVRVCARVSVRTRRS